MKNIAIVILIIVVIVVGIFIYKKMDLTQIMDANDIDPEDKGITDQEVLDVPDTLEPKTTVVITDPTARKFHYDMIAGGRKLSGTAGWRPSFNNGELTPYGGEHNGYIYILKNQIMGEYRFVIMQWIMGGQPFTTYASDVPKQTNFYIIPKDGGFNVDNAVDKGYIDWNTNTYVEVL